MEEMRHKEQEFLKMLILNNKNVLMKDIDISKGTVNALSSQPKLVDVEQLRIGSRSLGIGLIVELNIPNLC